LHKVRIAIIGGTGVSGIGAESACPERIPTPYGDAALERRQVGEREVVFLARHGVGHSIPPHRINYRANIWALRELGVRGVFATASVGSLNRQMPPGALVVLDQFLDFTKQRPLTFFDGQGGQVRHVDLTAPYCERLRQALIAAARDVGARCHPSGTYLCAEGPRFETAAEIRMFGQWGADVVGMTGVPEVVLAREAGLCYATLAIVANWAAGISPTPLSHEEVTAETQRHAQVVSEVLLRAAERIGDEDCSCRHPFPEA
jgi:5'-methylthioadenosine phosphorylase